MKPHLHGTGAHAGVAPAVDDVIVGVGIAMSVQFLQCIAQFSVQWHGAATVLALAGPVR